MNQRQLFQQHLAQTSDAPLCLEIVKAKENKLYDANGKSYIDLISGISVCNIGHGHPKVVAAIHQQAKDYMHIMVYGELIQTPQVAYAQTLVQYLAESLNSVYFTSSGSEAVEGAMKLAKRHTGRTKMIAFHNSYHGSTQGALSILGDEYWRNAYRPLLPDVQHLNYNEVKDLQHITEEVACVIVEPVQAEAGVNAPNPNWLKQLRDRCTDKGVLLILDEIQTGFGRTGTLFAYQGLGIVPDVLLLGKALGGGMPMGAFIANKKIMDSLSVNPVLGHITTFGGHPVCCAAGKAAMEVLLSEGLVEAVSDKSQLFISHLTSKKIQKITASGLMIAIHLENHDAVLQTINACLTHENAVFTDWFLFANNCIRIAPPLTITEEEILTACDTIGKILDSLT